MSSQSSSVNPILDFENLSLNESYEQIVPDPREFPPEDAPFPSPEIHGNTTRRSTTKFAQNHPQYRVCPVFVPNVEQRHAASDEVFVRLWKVIEEVEVKCNIDVAACFSRPEWGGESQKFYFSDGLSLGERSRMIAAFEPMSRRRHEVFRHKKYLDRQVRMGGPTTPSRRVAIGSPVSPTSPSAPIGPLVLFPSPSPSSPPSSTSASTSASASGIVTSSSTAQTSTVIDLLQYLPSQIAQVFVGATEAQITTFLSAWTNYSDNHAAMSDTIKDLGLSCAAQRLLRKALVEEALNLN
jgi:hypothetical protein